MSRRPTITDVARRAGVSVATVDRVLNGRMKVREETAHKVLEAAREIDYHAAGLIAQRLSPETETMRLGFVLHKEKQAFYHQFRQAIEEAARSIVTAHVEPVIRFCPSQSPDDFVAEIEALAGQVDAIAATAITHHSVADAVIEVQGRGTPVFALLNDFAQGVRQAYIGLNNLKIGRIAGYMVATSATRSGKIAVFVGGHRWHGHQLRETGFRSYFRECAPEFGVLDTLVNLETRQLTYEATLDLLARHADLRGIYVAGGGMEGAIAALREVREPGAVALVVNELTPESRAALSDRYAAMVIGTPLAELCRDAMTMMIDTVRSGFVDLAGQYFLDPRLYLPESV